MGHCLTVTWLLPGCYLAVVCTLPHSDWHTCCSTWEPHAKWYHGFWAGPTFWHLDLFHLEVDALLCFVSCLGIATVCNRYTNGAQAAVSGELQQACDKLKAKLLQKPPGLDTAVDFICQRLASAAVPKLENLHMDHHQDDLDDPDDPTQVSDLVHCLMKKKGPQGS